MLPGNYAVASIHHWDTSIGDRGRWCALRSGSIALVNRSVRCLAILAVMASIVAAPATASAHSRTTVTVFHAFTPDGTPTVNTRQKSGYCFSGALTVDRNDAWRCFIGNYIYDPCFSSPQAGGVVICPNAQVTGGVTINLTRGLPRKYADHRSPSPNAQPWNIQLTNGHHCIFASGATSVVDGKRLNYGCFGLNYALWGFPRRRTQPWTIFVAPYNAAHLSQSQRRAIRRVWT